MFGWLSRRLLARLPSRRLSPVVVRVSREGLHVRQQGADRLLAWASIDRATATMAGQVLGDQQTLILATGSGDMVMVGESDPVWRDLVDWLPVHLPGARRAAMWRLELAGGAGVVEVYRR